MAGTKARTNRRTKNKNYISSEIESLAQELPIHKLRLSDYVPKLVSSKVKARQTSPYRSSGSFESRLLEVLSLVVGVQGFRTGKVT